ncbi:MAG: sigma-54-dependent Fis family transcriptional regulator [Deltaproteobacteria bacterium]|nr:sigma-54-dependent Fis family transcriptional regulator [Deltaproteobacteria bacterium]
MGSSNPLQGSWQRCLAKYNIDPSTMSKTRILTVRELKNYTEPLEEFLAIARSGMKSMYERVSDAGYVILLGDAHGVTIEYLGNPNEEREHRETGLYLGSVWTESIEGTCGMGTCVEERRPITIHRDEHFRSRHISLSCSCTPIFYPDGSLLGTLDISLLRPPPEKESQLLALQTVSYYARLIENAYFLRLFKDCWIIRFNAMQAFVEVVAENIIAVDSEGRVVSGNASALRELTLRDGQSPLNLSVDEVFDLRFDELTSHALHKTTTILPVHTVRSGTRYFATFRAPELNLVHVPAGSGTVITPAASTKLSTSAMTLEYLAGTDSQMLFNLNCARRVMNKDISILLIGETGTGKEVFAHAVHDASDRSANPFVALNCASIPESLIESELFGYKQGAFTGAKSKGMRGKILQSDGGTLFLDEIGDMPLNLQTRLLRVLAEKEILPLGSETPVRVDLHVLCATLRNLEELVRKGEFREDLYYRLNGVTITLPPLRQRNDKALLIENILTAENGGLTKKIEPDAFEVLMGFPWPGNIRQLRNVLRYAMAVSEGESIQLYDLPPEILQASSLGLETIVRSTAASAQEVPPDSMQFAERSAILNVLKKQKWNITGAAVDLGISRATLYRKMKKYNIIPPNELEGPADRA